MSAYLVFGDNNLEWDDYEEWNVAVYYSLAAAEQHAKLANEWCLENWDSQAGLYKNHYAYLFDKTKQRNPYDATGHLPRWPDLQRPFYAVREIVLVRHVDEYLEHNG